MIPELLDALRALLTQTIISEEAHMPHALPSPQAGQEASKDKPMADITRKPQEGVMVSKQRKTKNG